MLFSDGLYCFVVQKQVYITGVIGFEPKTVHILSENQFGLLGSDSLEMHSSQSKLCLGIVFLPILK